MLLDCSYKFIRLSYLLFSINFLLFQNSDIYQVSTLFVIIIIQELGIFLKYLIELSPQYHFH